MNIKVIAICFNEEKILPYFLAHYERFADQIIVYDNCSTDQSPQIIKSHPKATLVNYKTNGKLDDKTYLKIKNHAWKNIPQIRIGLSLPILMSFSIIHFFGYSSEFIC